ncbi:hypothetical protein [Cellulomonas telluris]|uniref:hypothetical protein n=1 Tax=Cellulomonas telluris TaxID=2306636 RepID=UPI0027960D45|nr:hypothetical protein [Cellulomonas telluris]
MDDPGASRPWGRLAADEPGRQAEAAFVVEDEPPDALEDDVDDDEEPDDEEPDEEEPDEDDVDPDDFAPVVDDVEPPERASVR